MKAILSLMEQHLIPLANKVSSNRYLKAISNGSMALLGIIMLGSLFTVISTIPYEPYQALLTSSGIGVILSYVPDYTIDLLALYMAFSVGYQGAKVFGIEEKAFHTGVISLVCFLLLTPITALEGAAFLDLSYLGAKGVFVALLTGILTVKLMQFFVKRKITIQMPNGVPAMVMDSFSALIPAAAIVLTFALIKFGFAQTSYLTANTFIYTMLQTPIQSLTGSLPAFLTLILISQILWFFGVHGSMTVLPILFPVFLGYLAENTAAVEAGGTAVHPINFGLYDLACLGGCGATIGLVLLMFFFSKSKRYKAFSKMVLPCGLFGVNEPVIFGMPLMLNVLMLIPFLLTPIVIVSLGYLLIQLQIITPTIGVLGAGSLPPLIHGIVQGSLSFGIYEVFATIISMLIYYPFFKLLDKQAYAEECSCEE